MAAILSRLLVRLALLAASLAWAGFVFTQTVGDPGRGERIAAAVLADDDARAEVAAPITSAVMSRFGVPPEQRPVVAGQVDRVLSEPAGAQSFIDPFAGSWARMLGEDDPRPTEFDLAPLLAQFAATAPPGVAEGLPPLPDRLPVAGVPLPRAQLGWMADVRSAISAAVVPLAVLAVVLFAVALAIGDRRRVLRRIGVWAILAGASWVVIPPALVWLTRRWAPGADAVASAALDEAVSGLLPVAVVLAAVGALALVGSFVVPTADARAPAAASRGRARPRPVATRQPTQAAAPAAATSALPRTRTVEPTAQMPAIVTTSPERTSMTDAATMQSAARESPASDTAATDGSERTAEIGPTALRPRGRPDPARPPESATDDDGDALWEYYSSGPSR
jgi:hypothetical protein